ncbi:helix-turn-helix domain-containing protein [Lacibacterium aquatile]
MIDSLISKLKEAREREDIDPADLDEILGVGPGWIETFEAGKTTPTVDFILAIIRSLGMDIADVFKDIDKSTAKSILSRSIEVENKKSHGVKGAEMRFRYNSYLAKVFIPSANEETFEKVKKTFRDNLGAGRKTEAVVEAFMQLVSLWPRANPSDIWWFMMQRLYSDPYFHPATEAHRDFGQSWKRTAGWALERIIVEHYRERLLKSDIEIGIFRREQVTEFLEAMKLNFHAEAHKADILLLDTSGRTKQCFGVAHVKASIAERRQNDQSFSSALLSKNFYSPFVTMDCKSAPSSKPHNKGEFGLPLDDADDRRGDKRKEFEEEGYYSGCYSFNSNTIPTPVGQKATARIFVINFQTADDAFTKGAVAARNRLHRG